MSENGKCYVGASCPDGMGILIGFILGLNADNEVEISIACNRGEWVAKFMKNELFFEGIYGSWKIICMDSMPFWVEIWVRTSHYIK